MTNIPMQPRPTNLDAEIRGELDASRRACLRAERAGLLGRQGHFEMAQAELDALQDEFSTKPDAQVSAWGLISRGWLAHSMDDPNQSRGHMQRAHALSVAAGLTFTRAISAAWLAHFAYLQDDFSKMATLLTECIGCVKPNDHAAQARLSLVLAQGYHFADRFGMAQYWYIRAREHAMSHSDQATLSALNYNIAARRSVCWLRASIFGLDLSDEVRLADAGLQSSRSFDGLLGISAFSQWAPLVQATILSSKMQFRAAVEMYTMHLGARTAPGRLGQHRASFLADSAWCRWNIGDAEQAAREAHEAILLSSGELYVEDRVTVFGRLGQYFAGVGNQILANEFTSKALRSNVELEKMQGDLRELLASVVVPLSSSLNKEVQK